MPFPEQHVSATIASYCAALPFPVSQQQQRQLLAFLALIHKWNKAYNLTSVRDPVAMVAVHLMDSIAVHPHLAVKTAIDVGTGAGLPGIPLAIMQPDTQFVLLDSLGKRVRFLKQVAFELKLANIESVQARVEDYHPQRDFDGVITRAYASIGDMLDSCQHLVTENGEFIALKGQFPKRELQGIPAQFTMRACHRIAVPGLDAQRHVIILKKQ